MPDKNQTRDRTHETTVALLWLATTVVAIAGFVILSTARIFEDYIDVQMPDTLSRGTGWLFAVAWIMATGAIVGLTRGGRTRKICIALLTVYLIAMALIALQFMASVWSPTWSLA